MANVKCNVASDLVNLKPATNEEYSSLVGELYTNQKNGFVNNWVGNQTRGVKGINEAIIAEHKRDAEDVFSSAILYMLEKAYANYKKQVSRTIQYTYTILMQMDLVNYLV